MYKYYTVKNFVFDENLRAEIMTIEEIYQNGKLSVRAYNVCKNHNFRLIVDLKNYYAEFNSFNNLNKCGTRTVEELIRIISPSQEINLFNSDKKQDSEENSLESVILKLTSIQKEVINSYILYNSNKLSVRSKTLISSYLNNDFKIINFGEKILLSDIFSNKYLPEIDNKSCREMYNYISQIKSFLIEVEAHDEKKALAIKNKYLIQQTYGIPTVLVEILKNESIFLITDFLLNHNAFFINTQTEIFKKTCKVYQDQAELTLEEIADKLKVTQEKVRQVRKIFFEDIFNRFNFILNFNDELFQNYDIDTNSNQIDINISKVNIINKSCKTNFSKEFIVFILSVYLHEKYSLVGEIEDVLSITSLKVRTRYNWTNLYLIKIDIAKDINFDELLKDIEFRMNDRIDETYSFNFKSYLSRFLTSDKNGDLDSILPIAKNIVSIEFEMYLDIKESITFKRNTVKTAAEYAYEALELLGKSSSIAEIVNKLHGVYPNYVTDESKIRGAMKRKAGFVPIGRNSVFGLKKWENEFENFKGGTIKEILIDFLKKRKEPLHITILMNYLEKYRDSKNKKSILNNLKADPSKRFLFYNQDFVGLIENEIYYNERFKRIPIHLGKKIISKYEQGYTLVDIMIYLNKLYDLTFEESKLIINSQNYFSKNKVK